MDNIFFQFLGSAITTHPFEVVGLFIFVFLVLPFLKLIKDAIG